MPRRAVYPRNEQSRADRWAYHETVVAGLPRQKKARSDAMQSATHGTANISIGLSGTAIAGGVTEEMIVDGGETVIITLTNDTWVPSLGDNNDITTAFLEAITGDGDVGGWSIEVDLVHGNLVRTSETIVTLTLPSTAGYTVASDEAITVAPPASALDNGIPPASETFDVTADVIIALTGTAVAGGVLESEIATGSETLIITITGDTWVATLGDDNDITTDFLAAITGDLADVAGWNAEVGLLHGQLTRDTGLQLTLILPASSYVITSGDETVTVAPPADSLTGGIVPVVKTFVITEGS